MELAELLEIAEKERQAQKPVQVRCCTAAGCLSAQSAAVVDALKQAVHNSGAAERVEVIPVGCMRLCCQGPLVSVDLWERVQGVLDGRFAKKHRRMTHDFAFSGWLATWRSLVTLNTPGTVLARIPAASLSAWRSTTPYRVTLPFCTDMRIGCAGFLTRTACKKCRPARWRE